MNRAMNKKVDDYIDKVFSELDSHIEETNFIVSKKSNYKKEHHSRINADLEVTEIRDYIDGFMKRNLVTTNYDKFDRPIISSSTCYIFEIDIDPYVELEKSDIFDTGSIVLEYAKSTSKDFSRYIKTVCNANGISRKIITNVYDMDDKIIEKRTVNESNDHISSIIETYNNGLLIKMVEYTDIGQNTTEFKYNSNRNIIFKKQTRIDRSKDEILVIIDTYDYDEFNRCIKENVVKRESEDNGDNWTTITDYNTIYSYYTIDGKDIRVATNITKPDKSSIRVYGKSSNSYIDYNISKRTVTVMDDNLASTGLTFSEDYKSLEVNYANIETMNRGLYYINDRYNNIDNLKYSVIDPVNHTWTNKEYKGKASQKQIATIVSDIFEYNFNITPKDLFIVSKKVAELAKIELGIGY